MAQLLQGLEHHVASTTGRRQQEETARAACNALGPAADVFIGIYLAHSALQSCRKLWQFIVAHALRRWRHLAVALDGAADWDWERLGLRLATAGLASVSSAKLCGNVAHFCWKASRGEARRGEVCVCVCVCQVRALCSAKSNNNNNRNNRNGQREKCHIVSRPF